MESDLKNFTDADLKLPSSVLCVCIYMCEIPSYDWPIRNISRDTILCPEAAGSLHVLSLLF